MAYGFHTRLMAVGYQRALKPLLFRFDPEDVHDRFTTIGRFCAASTLGRAVIRTLFRYDDPVLETKVAGLTFSNPVGLAAGFDKNALLWDILPDVGFGFAELGSITGKSCAGNARPRLWRMPAYEALQVYYGLKNEGADVISARLRGVKPRMILGISAAKTNSAETANPAVAIADYRHVVCELEDADAAASGWKAGYYRIELSPAQTIERLGPPRKPWETSGQEKSGGT